MKYWFRLFRFVYSVEASLPDQIGVEIGIGEAAKSPKEEKLQVFKKRTLVTNLRSGWLGAIIAYVSKINQLVTSHNYLYHYY